MSKTCAVCKKGKGPEICEVCGFTDGGEINKELLDGDAEHWFETVVKPYRERWEVKTLATKLLEPKDVVTEIVRRFGDGVLLDSQKLSGLISDVIPEEPKLRKRLKLAIDENVPQKLHELKNEGEDERNRVMKIEASEMSETYGMLVEMAYDVVNCFAAALGYRKLVAAAMDDAVGIEMVFVQGGTFNMGATAEQGKSNFGITEPVHSVTLSDFYIGKYVVTQKQWKAMMGSNPSKFTGNDNLPVETVIWSDIQEFIRRLNWKTGKKYRLPTEAEWEYAARGGNKSKRYKYSGSDNIDDVAWYAENSNRMTHPVGGKMPNELGIYDMCGNVCEWVNDWFDMEYYKKSPKNNPTGPTDIEARERSQQLLRESIRNRTIYTADISRYGPFCVLRGGGWRSDAHDCRISTRFSDSPISRKLLAGFRLALSYTPVDEFEF